MINQSRARNMMDHESPLIIVPSRDEPAAISRTITKLLHLAAKHGDIATIKRLVEQNGANIHSCDSKGWSALAWAVSEPRVSTVVVLKILEMTTLDIARQFRSNAGRSLVDIALSRGCVDHVILLLKHGVKAVSNAGDIPLEYYVDVLNRCFEESDSHSHADAHEPVADCPGDVADETCMGPVFDPLNFGDAPTEILEPSDEEGSGDSSALCNPGSLDSLPLALADFGDASTEILESSEYEHVAGPSCSRDAMSRNHRHAQAVIQGPTLHTALLIQSRLETDDDVHDRVRAVRHTPQFSRRSSEKFDLPPRAPKIARIGFVADVTEDDDLSCDEIILPVHPARLLREQRARKAARVGVAPDVTQDDDVSRDLSVLLVHPVRQ